MHKSTTRITFAIFLALQLVLGAAVACHAAVPVEWASETTRVAPFAIEAYHGEELTLKATLTHRAKPLDLTGETFRLYWQTNGMGSAYWQTNATVVATNAVTATWRPEFDTGAPAVRGFLGAAGSNYRAAFELRFRSSPGASPNALPLPTPVIDFSRVTVLNPPWPTSFDAPVTSVNGQSGAVVVTGADLLMDPDNYGDSKIADLYTYTHGELRAHTLDRNNPHQVSASQIGAVRTNENGVIDMDLNVNGRIDSTATIHASGFWRREAEGLPSEPVVYSISTGGETLHGAVDLDPVLAPIQSQVSAIGAHLNAEDARFVATNFDSTVHLPEAYVEIKMSNSWIMIWREMTRWNKFTGDGFDWDSWAGFESWRANIESELSCKAERNWGLYDSETGGLSPDGYTQISSTNILIAAGMAYQRTVTSGGAVWVLQCNSGTAQLGGDTNGFFRVRDSDGHVQFEIVKGDRREMGADASGITVDNSTSPPTVHIPYSVESDEHPTLRICTDLTTADWQPEGSGDCPATVTWGGESGAWTASVQRKVAGSSLFVQASYMAGGETYIRNGAPVSMDSIMLGGVKYYLGTAVISGNTVLTLSTTPNGN